MSPRENAQSVAAVHENLREAIITGQIKAGAVSSQLALSRDFGVGRTPLREALRLLQSEGLVAGDPNKRVRVADLSGSDLEELYILRILAETAAVRLTIPGIDSADIAEMRGYMAQMDHYKDEGDWGGLRAPHKAFHEKFVSAAGPRIHETISNLFDHGERYRQAYLPPTVEQWAERQAEHLELVDAAIQRDADLTAKMLTHHYIRTALLVLAALEPGRQPTRLNAIIDIAADDGAQSLPSASPQAVG